MDAPRPCIGVCTDRRVERVLAEDDAALTLRVEQLEQALALIARTTPKPDRLTDSWQALQARVKQLLEAATPLY